ncbi:serine/threonine-protein kinase PBL27-like [Hibiscus syriacus]|uniref:serine/threonine-protein kinase PBL27-like n=1 Tax=Hibiscus syriacus TaxID=106335 RepID=UPI0019241223|nr:serine/threonine-protein kinase PBL27-like [Hibiscus syriacus]
MGGGGCFPCFGSSNKEETNGGGSIKELGKKDSAKDGSVGQSHHVNRVSLDKSKSQSATDSKKEPAVSKNGPTENIAAQTFTFRELAAATRTLGRSVCWEKVVLDVFTKVVWRVQDR